MKEGDDANEANPKNGIGQKRLGGTTKEVVPRLSVVLLTMSEIVVI